MDIKRRGDESKFVRVSPGKYTLRELIPAGEPAAPPHDLAVSSSQIAETSPEA